MLTSAILPSALRLPPSGTELAQFKRVNLVSPFRVGIAPRRFSTAVAAAGLLVVASTALISPFSPTARAGVPDKPLLNNDKPLGADKPLAIKDICLMLRGGDSNQEVLSQIAARRLLDPVDAAAEKQLLASGATPAFISTVKAGNYNLSAADAAAARQKQAAVAQRVQAGRAAEAQVAATNHHAEQFKQGEADGAKLVEVAQADKDKPLQTASSPVMGNLLRGKLTVRNSNKFLPYKDSLLTTKRLYGIYFSASSSAPSQQFTQDLVKFYDKAVQIHPEFEIILVCRDRSAADMQKYMDDEHMNWPAVPFTSIPQMTALTKYEGSQMPDLVLVDDSGRVISDSFRSGTYVGPDQVIRDLMKIFTTPQ